MSHPILPENVNHFSNDFLFQRELYVGLGADQFNVRARFAAVEQLVTQIQTSQGTAGTAITNLTTRVSTLETNQAGISMDLSGVVNSLSTLDARFTEHIDAALIHVTDTIRNHPDDAAVHVPAGGIEGDVLAMTPEGVSAWKRIMSLLPADLQSIIENGGSVTPDQILHAFQVTTVAVWTTAGLPFGATRIKAATWAGDRFIVGASNGQITYTYDARVWQPVTTLFPGPYAAAVESISYAVATSGETPCIALDAYSDFCISLDRTTWSPRLSVRVERSAEGHYKDKYSTNDFTCTVAGRGLFLLLTTTGEIYRATYQEVIDEYHRMTGNQGGDRHSTIWKLQESNFSITQGVLDAASGGNVYITVGSMGRMAISEAATIWEAIASPFGASNINGIAAGDDRFVAVADNGKIGYALYSNPRQWRLIETNPFGTESIRAIAYGNGVWIAVSESGNVLYSRNGMAWTEAPAHMVAGGTCIAFGDTFFLVGDTSGNLVRSQSLASMFAVVTRAEFAAFTEELLHWSAEETAKLLAFVNEQLARIDVALAKQLTVGNTPGKMSVPGGSAGTLQLPVLDENGEPVLDEDGHPVMRPQTEVPAIDHAHDNSNTVLTSQLDRASIYDPYPTDDPAHWQGLAILDKYGKLFARNQTWQRAEAGGIAPLDENGLVPSEYIADGWAYLTLINALRDQMLISWAIQNNTIFQDLGDRSRINAFACSKTTIVAVGENGKIGWGPQLDKMQLVVNGSFGRDSVVGVAHGTRPDGEEIFVTVSQTQFSVSQNGSDWSEAVDLSGELQGVFFGGGYFLIPDADGTIWRSDWDTDGNLAFLEQDSSPLVTRGVVSIAYLENKWVGVGSNNKIVGTNDPAYWNEEPSPLPADTTLNSVCAGNGFFLAVGNYARMMRGTAVGTWTEVKTTVTNKDLHCVLYAGLTYLAVGKNGTIISSASADTDSWKLRNSKTTSTIRAGAYFNERYFVGSDTGQFIASASVSDVLWVDTGGGVGPSNDIPNPIDGEGSSGIKNTFMRSDAVIPDTGVVMEKRVGIPTTYKTFVDPETGETATFVDRYGVPFLDDRGWVPGEQLGRSEPGGVAALDDDGRVPDDELGKGVPGGVAELDEKGWVPDEQLGKAKPGGTAPLDEDNLVPKIHLPPFDVNLVIEGMKNNLEFVEIASPFKQGPLISSILHDGAALDDVVVLVGEAGIGWSNNVTKWQLVETQPLTQTPIGVTAGLDFDGVPILVAIDTQKSFSTSRDGKTWTTAITLDGDYDFSHISYYNRRFVITCTNGQVLRSMWTDGVLSFVEQEDGPEFTRGLTRTVGGDGKWYGIGTGGIIRYSLDVSHFTPVESPTTKNLYAIAYGKTRFAAGGEDGELIVTGEDGKWKIGPKPFTGNADLMGLAYIETIGTFIVTNRNGEIAVSTNLDGWSTVPSTSAVAVRAITHGVNAIVIGNDLGEIAASRKVYEFGDTIGTGGNVTIVVPRAIVGDYGTFQAIDQNAQPTGEIQTGVRILRNQQEINAVFTAGFAIDAAGSTGENILPDNIVDEARTRNPLVEDLEVDGK